MAITYTARTYGKLGKHAAGDIDWHTQMNLNLDEIDRCLGLVICDSNDYTDIGGTDYYDADFLDQKIDGSSITLDASNHVIQVSGWAGGTISDDDVQTTDETETNIKTITLTENYSYFIETRIIGSGTNDAVMFHVLAIGERDSGGSAQSTFQIVNGIKSDGADDWGITVDTNGNDIRIRVTGKAATTINWTASTWYKSHVKPT